MKAIWNKVKKEPLLSILSVLLTLTFVAFVGVLLSERTGTHISELPGLSEKNLETLKFVGIGMGGLLVALQALMSYKRAKALEDTAKTQADAAKAQARATEEQATANKLTEQGQRQDRLKNAIEHLGHKSDSVRLGGAYELFHLAKDTLEEDAKEKLSQTVLDILCAHIRQTTGESEYREAHKSKPSEEIQSLLTLLFVQKHEVFKDCHINLQGSWLKWADLREARLEKTILVKAQLQGAWLDDAQLQEARLDGVQLQGAWLIRAHMQGAWLGRAQLQGTMLGGAQLQGAWLNEAHIQGAWLSETKLQGTQLGEAQLQGAALDGAQLQGAWLHKAQLQGIRVRDWSDEKSFEDRIREQIGKKCDLPEEEVAFEGGLSLPGVIFEGGLSQEDVDSLVEDMSDEKANMLRMKLKPHIGQPKSNRLMENSGAIIGSYTEEEAEKWIAEYKEAVPEVPENDS